MSQNGQRFGFSRFALQASQEFLSFRVVAEKQDGRFREGPLEVNVADLFAGEAIVLSSRLATALHQTAVGDKLLHPREASDVMNLVENRQGQYRCRGPNGADRRSGDPVVWPGW